MQRRAVLALCAGVVLSAGSAFAADPLRVGANIGNVPWEFQDDSGKTVGFEIDVANEIGKRLGREVTFENIPFNGLFSAVQSGRIDLAMSSITITDERLKTLSFAQPYYDSDQSLTVMKDSGITGTKDLADKVVGVDTGSTGDMWATAHQAELKIKEIRRFEGLAPAMLDLQNKGIDGYVSDIPALQYYVKDKPAYSIVERITTGEKYSVMMAKDSPLLAEVDKAIGAMKADGFMAATHKNWFGTDAEAGSSTITALPLPQAKP